MKDGYFKHNPGIAKMVYGAGIVASIVILALVFGPDEVRIMAREMLQSAGLIAPDTIQPEVTQ